MSALVYRLLGRPRRAAVLIFLLALSHWVLDFVTHRPDMPLLPLAGPRLGLGLWSSRAATILVEGLFFASAVFLYAKKRTPHRGFFALIALLVALYAASLFGPPPPSVTAIALSGIALVPVLWWWGNWC